MASIRKRGNKWQAQVRRTGFPAYTKTFASKSAATHWTNNIEQRLAVAVPTKSDARRLACLVERYLIEVTPMKRCASIEQSILRAFLRTPLAQIRLKDLTVQHVAAYRDERKARVTGSTIIREFSLLARCLSVAEREWQIHVPVNAFRDVEKPRANAPRNRRLAAGELDRLLEAARSSRSPYMEPLIIVALETAMRQGELLKLHWHHIDPQNRQCSVVESKNGFGRSVPLTEVAMDVLAKQPFDPGVPIFRASYSAVRQAWRRVTRKAQVTDLHFHDLRHEAISRLVEVGLTLPEVGAISGHRDTRTLLRYAHPDSRLLVSKLPPKLMKPEQYPKRLPMQAFEWLPLFASRSLNEFSVDPDWPGQNNFDEYKERVNDGLAETFGISAPKSLEILIEQAFGKRLPVGDFLQLVEECYRLKKIS